jgi:peptidoglycan hydrolase-like protein with peptidoglycan-binding domain
LSATSDFRETPASEAAETELIGHGRHTKRRRAYVVTAGVLAVAVGGGGAAAFMLNDNGARPSGRQSALPAATAEITRGDVIDTESVDGKLTYADERSLAAATSGVVTWAPAEGATITRGKPLLKVNGKPVTLMYGSLPLYRTLRQGIDDGRDVKQLESNLKALGYGDNMTADNEFTAATAEAVKAWQDDLGLPETGSVDASQVVFQSGAVRVSDLKATLGNQVGPGQAAMTVTGTKRIVHVDLDATKQTLAKKGAAVTIELPGGKEIKGRIATVGTVAKSSSSDQDNPEDDDSSAIDVDISVSGKGTGRLDEAPVSVDMESERAKNVLSVPIEALLALREGGFGVEVVEGGKSRIVPVELGTYGGGRVQVTGTGLNEGMKVGVPPS